MSPRVHHLNFGTMRPLSARLLNGRGSLFERGEMVCHCLLVEHEAGLLLVDSGIGTRDIEARPRMGAFFDFLAEPLYAHEETAIRQIAALGYDPRDVTQIVLTHLDFDHAGGLVDLPWAAVHVHETELEAATRRATLHDRRRYVPDQWAHKPKWITHRGEERWFDFAGACPIAELDGVWLVPLPGHTLGHCGVALRTDEGWLLHCGDAYYHRGQTDPLGDWCPAGCAAFQQLSQTDRALRLATLEQIRALVRYHASEVTHFSSHDADELRLLAGAA